METSHSTPPIITSKWYRPHNGRVIFGVCAGLAKHFGWSLTALRIFFIVLIPLPISALFVYLVLWIIMPDESKVLTQHNT